MSRRAHVAFFIVGLVLVFAVAFALVFDLGTTLNSGTTRGHGIEEVTRP